MKRNWQMLNCIELVKLLLLIYLGICLQLINWSTTFNIPGFFIWYLMPKGTTITNKQTK